MADQQVKATWSGSAKSSSYWLINLVACLVFLYILAGQENAAFLEFKSGTQDGYLGVFGGKDGAGDIEVDSLGDECKSAAQGTAALYIIFLFFASFCIVARVCNPLTEKFREPLLKLMAIMSLLGIIASVYAVASFVECHDATEDTASDLSYGPAFWANVVVVVLSLLSLAVFKPAYDGIQT